MSLSTTSIVTNLLGMNANRQLGIVNDRKAKSTEKLSSGYKINRSADDAAGLAISEKMRRQIRGLHQSAENINEGVGYCQVADGALNEVDDMLKRMTELAIKAANGTEDDADREYIDKEMQQLKGECNRIFKETSYNDRLIWKANAVKQIGSVTQPAVKRVSTYSSFDIKLNNYDKIPYNGFKVTATAGDGVQISWKDYNNTEHTTEFVSWDTLKENNYRFEISDYFGGPDGPNSDLYDAGLPVIKHTVAFNPNEASTIDDMVTSLNGRSISNGASASMNASWEGADTSGKFSISGPSLNYGAAYASRHNSASGYNFDTPDDIFIEPSLTENSGLSNLTRHPTATTVEDALTDNTGWQFSFNMEGIGPVKATVTGISYSTNDYQEEDEGRWWSWYNYTYNGQPRQERRGHSYSAGNTLQSLMNSLTGNTGSLPKSAGGMNDGTASYTMSMSITSDSPYSYGTSSSSTVGSMSLSFTVGQSDTQQTVLDKINRALNDTTILDFSKSSSGNDSGSFSYMTVGSNTIEEPIWGGVCNIDIQAGPEADHVIDIMYDELGLYQLGIYTANTLTQDDASAAIEQLKTAEYVVNEQRAQFGAYQNRLEHAYKVNKNAEENTQYAESQIRDTDMAKEMVANAKDNILQQAGQTMLAQANQSRQGMLQLLS